MGKRGDKIYVGFYNYFRGEAIYCEEEFEVYKNYKDFSLNFLVNQYVLVGTGEMLRISVDYTVTKNFTPENVLVKRALGQEFAVEVYTFNKEDNTLSYTFLDTHKKTQNKIPVPPKFTIATPCTSTSMLHMKTKKEDTLSKNYYSIVASTNSWHFEHRPRPHIIVMEKLDFAPLSLPIDGHPLSAMAYKVSEKDSSKGPHSFLKVYLSKHISIPYLIESKDQTRIQIKYLNHLDSN